GWGRSMAINAVGAVATALVLLIVIQTKFVHGAWIVIAAMPIIVVGFYGIHRHYEAIRRQLRRGGAALAETPRNTVVLLVEGLNAATARAVGYVRSFAGRDFRAIHVPTNHTPGDLADRWQAFCRTDVELEVLAAKDHPTK